MKAKFYQVGGCVRDELLGLNVDDIDFSVEADNYEAMKAAIIERCGGDPLCVKVESPQHFTIRAVDPNLGGVDFVLCRKDGQYIDGRHPESVTQGTLNDDLARRDFTVNAIAKDEKGDLFDPFDGIGDLHKRLLRCVGDTKTRMEEDGVRVLRALRFAMTKGLHFAPELLEFMNSYHAASVLERIHTDRVFKEVKKCFEYSEVYTITHFAKFPHLLNAIFLRNLKLVPKITDPKPWGRK